MMALRSYGYESVNVWMYQECVSSAHILWFIHTNMNTSVREAKQWCGDSNSSDR